VDEELDVKKIVAVIDATFAVAKRKKPTFKTYSNVFKIYELSSGRQ